MRARMNKNPVACGIPSHAFIAASTFGHPLPTSELPDMKRAPCEPEFLVSDTRYGPLRTAITRLKL
ncbi:hypothetical protein GJ744_011483 [Endocarpon pusillum]|uniref:Uncharacterized protein n=1 Tax=Endocarpon pusillum TaxID=364733 RepID=A0A8H7AEU2_9EURO|nr:hypothetical protein GJ744_011483 [Endocarpon pusillum]